MRVVWSTVTRGAAAFALSLVAAALVACGDGGGASTPSAGGTASPMDVAADLARELSGADVEIRRGPQHTVYHSLGTLPSASAPRADGRPTLIWFSAPT